MMRFLALQMVLMWNILHIVRGDCGPPPVIEDSTNNATTDPTFAEGVVILYQCGFAFVREGVPFYTCSDGNWTNGGRDMECVWKTCGYITVDHGTYVTESHTVGNVANFSCDDGYELKGPDSAVCRSHRRWTEVPVCEEVHCDPLPDRELISRTYTYVNGNSNVYGCTVENTCTLPGYKLIGSSRRFCLADGTWSGEEAFCQIINCGEPDIGDGTVEANSTEYGGTGTVVCNEGSVQIGSEVMTCTENGWSHSYCRRTKCYIDRIDNGTVSTQEIQHGDPLEWSCDIGYAKLTNDEVICNDGVVEPEPACQQVIIDGAACPSPENGHSIRLGNFCYLFLRDYMNPREGRVQCYLNGLFPLTVENEDKMDEINNVLTTLDAEHPVNRHWIDLQWDDDTEQWKWPSEAVTYTNWMPGEGEQTCILACWKNEKCAYMERTSNGWLWDDTECDDEAAPACYGPIYSL